MVWTKFVEVILTVVNVPAIFKLPDKLKLDPVIVVPDKVPALIELPTTFVAESKPEVTRVLALTVSVVKVVETRFVIVAFVDAKAPDETTSPPSLIIFPVLLSVICKLPPDVDK